jgi:hypothetical protein
MDHVTNEASKIRRPFFDIAEAHFILNSTNEHAC